MVSMGLLGEMQSTHGRPKLPADAQKLLGNFTAHICILIIDKALQWVMKIFLIPAGTISTA